MAIYKDEERGTWYCSFYYTDWQGNKKKKMKRGFKLQREAKEWERQFLESYSKNPDITFEALYAKFKTFKKGRVRETTFYLQTHCIELYILPYFNKLIVSEITPSVVAEWQTWLIEKELTPSHLRQINSYLSMIFNYAVNYLDLQKNPVRGQICKPKKAVISFWTPEEYHSFYQYIKDDIEWATAFDILYYTGIRTGELLGLTWKDVDLDHSILDINKTFTYCDGKSYINPPKTEKGKRKVAITHFLVDEIKDYKQRLYKPEPDQRVFDRSISWLRGVMKKIYNEHPELKRIRVHDLRHSHASVLINLGANPLMIAERLGHEDVKVTMNTYSHLFESHHTEIIEKLENLK